MPDFKAVFEGAKTWLTSNATAVAIGVVAVVLIVGAIYFGQKYLTKKFLNKDEEEDLDEESTCEFIFFYTTWCPYSKKAMEEWTKFSKQWNGTTKDGVTIVMTEIDCDQNEAVANKFDINGYPTIKCVMNGKVTNFDARPTLKSLNLFLESCFA